MSKKYCYIASGLHVKLAELVGDKDNFTPKVFATLHGLYNKEHPDTPLDLYYGTELKTLSEEKLKDIKDTLVKYRQELQTRDTKIEDVLSSVLTEDGKDKRTLASMYIELAKLYSSNTLLNRINFISDSFSTLVDSYMKKIQEAGYKISRDDIIQGNNPFGLNQESLFKELCLITYKKSLQYGKVSEKKNISEEAREKNLHIYTEYNTILDNWVPLITLAKYQLNKTEGLPFKFNTASTVEEELDNVYAELTTTYNADESTRESWQEVKEYISAFGTIGVQVRRVLGRFTDVEVDRVEENGVVILKEKVDDINAPIRLSPVKVHQILIDIVRNSRNSAQMLSKLQKAIDYYPWLASLAQKATVDGKTKYNFEKKVRDREGNIITVLQSIPGKLTTDSELRTKFFVDLCRDFQPYVMLLRGFKNGMASFRTKILNRADDAKGNFLAKIGSAKIFGSSKTFYTKEGKVNIERLKTLVDKAKLFITTKEEKDTKGNIKLIYEASITDFLSTFNKNVSGKKAYIKEILDILGVDYTNESISLLLQNTRYLHSFANSVSKLILNGLPQSIGEKSAKALFQGNDVDLTNIKLDAFIKHNNEVSIFAEHANKISALLVGLNASSRLESSAVYIDKHGNSARLQSNVPSSYLGDFIKDIHSFVEEEGTEINKRKRDDNTLNGLQEYLINGYLCSSYFRVIRNGQIHSLCKWVEDLYFSDLSNPDSFAAQFQFSRFVGDQSTTFENFDSRDHALSMLAMYTSEKEKNSKSKYSWYPTFILGDSNASKYIKALRYRVDDIIGVDKPGYLLDVYRSEIAMMKLIAAARKQMKGDKDKDKDEYKYNPLYAADSKVQTDKEGRITSMGDQTPFTLLTFLNKSFADGKYYNIATKSGDFTEADVQEAIKVYRSDAVDTFIQKLVDVGVIAINDKGGYDYSNISNFLDNFKKYNVSYATSSQDEVFRAFIEDYFWNTKFATINQLQLLTISPIFYKDTKELQKRYKEIHASGSKCDVTEETQTVIYFKEEHTNTEFTNPTFMQAFVWHNLIDKNSVTYDEVVRLCTPVYDEYGDELKEANESRLSRIKELIGEDKFKIYKEYRDVEATDGQGYRTLESYKKILETHGDWGEREEQVYRKIKAIRQKAELTAEDLKELSDLAVVFQPIKPFMYTIEKYKVGDDILPIPVQHKYAEIVLIPELLAKGSKLRTLAEAMENNKDEKGNDASIDLALTTKGVKVGYFGEVDLWNSDNIATTLQSAYRHVFNLSDYRIQTNVPNHGNEARSIGTQSRKLIMGNLTQDKDYSDYLAEYGGKVNLGITGKNAVSLDGHNLMTLYNGIIVTGILDTFVSCVEEFANIEGLSKTLVENVISTSREQLDNIIAYALDEEGKFNLPLFEGTLEHDSMAMLLSMFKNRVNKQKIQGGAAVQASAMGITGISDDENLKAIQDPDNKGNILYVEAEMPFDFSYMRGRQKVELNYADYCDIDSGKVLLSNITFKLPDGATPIDGKVTVNGYTYYINNKNQVYKITNGTKVFMRNEYLSFKDKDGNYTIPKIELEFPHILDRVAYRIPTERCYSMLNLKCVRFSKKVDGGTVKVPLHYTKVAGFDFDIDKLYFMCYEYQCKSNFLSRIKLPKEQIAKIIAKVGELNPSFVEIVPPIFEENFSQEQLFDIFGNIYENIPELKAELSQIRYNSGEYRKSKRVSFKNGIEESYDWYIYDHPLNYYFEQSELVKQLAEKEGLTVAEYKQKLVSEAAAELGIAPELVQVKEKYYRLNEETITAAGLTKKQVFEEAAKSLGIEVAAPNDAPVILSDYDISKSPLDNTKAARNNMLINLMRHRLMDEDTFDDRYTPGGFAHPSAAARVMRELLYGNVSTFTGTNGKVNLDKVIELSKNKDTDPEPNYDPSDPYTIIYFNEQNQIAGKLIGAAANQNTNQALTSLIYTYYSKTPIIFGKMLEGGKIVLKSGKDTSTENRTLGQAMLAKSIEYSDKEIVDIDLSIAEILASSVDAVKDPVLNYLNLNNQTISIGFALARLGYSMTDIGLLLNQPIVREVCRTARLNNTTLSNAILSVKNKYVSNHPGILENLPSNDTLTSEQLATNIILGREGSIFTNAESVAQQLKVLELFSKLAVIGEEVNQYVGATKFTSSSSVGSTTGDLYEQQGKTQRYIDKYLPDAEGKNGLLVETKATRTTDTPIVMNIRLDVSSAESIQQYFESIVESPFAYEQCMFDCNRNVLASLKDVAPYENPSFVGLRHALQQLCYTGNLKAATINTAHKDAVLYTISTTQSEFNGNLERSITENGEVRPISFREFYNFHFAKLLMEGIGNIEEDTNLNQFEIFRWLTFTTEEVLVNEQIPNEDGTLEMQLIKKPIVMMNIPNVSGIELTDRNKITDSWRALFNSEDPRYRQLAKDLFFYCYYIGGLEFSPQAFIHLAPVELKINLATSYKLDEEGNFALDKDGYRIPISTYKDLLNQILNGKLNVSTKIFANPNFLKQFILNNIDDTLFRFIPYGEIKQKLIKLATVNGKYQTSFEVTTSDEEIYPFITYKSYGKTAFIPLIILKDNQGNEHVYMADGDTLDDHEAGTLFNVGEERMVYREYKPLGNKSLSIYNETLEQSQTSNGIATVRDEGVKESNDSVHHGIDDNIINTTAEKLADAIFNWAIENLSNTKDDNFTQEQIDAFLSICKLCGIFFTDSDNYIIDPFTLGNFIDSNDKEGLIKKLKLTLDKLLSSNDTENSSKILKLITEIQDNADKNGVYTLAKDGIIKLC